MNKKLTQEEQILADVDDELYLLKKRIQLKFDLSWSKARDGVNRSIKALYGLENGKKI